jgi:hypothetical protein
MVGVEQRFGQQRSNVPAAQSIHHSLPAPVAFYQASEPQLRQMLASHRRATASDRGKAGHVQLAIA